MVKEERGVVLLHPAPFSMAFDVFVKKEYIKRRWVKRIQGWLYEVEECPFVKEFLKRYEGYVYIGSEDFDHIPSVNREIEDNVLRLLRNGFILRVGYKDERKIVM
ncbi:MAG: hypothetical protein ACTSR0_03955 [Candidatus Asgardarchaeia archaeon]